MTSRNTNILDRLKVLRTHWGISQVEMSKRMGVTHRSYQNYETGGHQPKARDLAGLADFGVSLDWLLTGRGEMFGARPEGLDIPTAQAIDADIMARVMDGVAGVFRQLNQTARPSDLGRFAAEIYPDVADIADEAELRGALTVLLRHLRERLLRAASGDTSGKLQA